MHIRHTSKISTDKIEKHLSKSTDGRIGGLSLKCHASELYLVYTTLRFRSSLFICNHKALVRISHLCHQTALGRVTSMWAGDLLEVTNAPP
ncbi:hypothetical protein CDAR_607771 [Caerostris darwini]|uniref:Uncharacterized protein n=1 Tax=Caerostris darwini TaxID=1538125 RepID=A0AAV4ULF3_9ARAC|nr:hypothetical protein CDAR_607771 [Caerostris darwini]